MLKDIFNPVRVTASVAGKEFIFENGRIANQADGSVCLQCGGTVVLVTVCSAALEADKGFFPLTVEYSERMYAAGRIPGSYFRREIGRPSEPHRPPDSSSLPQGPAAGRAGSGHGHLR